MEDTALGETLGPGVPRSLDLAPEIVVRLPQYAPVQVRNWRALKYPE